MRRTLAALYVLLASLALTGVAEAFDWAGKIQQDLKDLKSPNARVRRLAVQRLGTYSGTEAKSHLLAALKDLDPSVQRAAAKVAAERGYREAVPAVVRWLSSWDEAMRIAAAETLGALGDRKLIKTLVRALNDPEHTVRLKIVSALGRLGHRDAVVPLLARLGDTNVKVRKATVSVLAKIGDHRAVLPLMSRLSDTAREVRLEAVKALGTIGDRRAAVAITRLLRDPSAEVVEATVATLGHLRHKDATEPLIELLQAGPSQHREKAAAALGQIGTPLALRALLRALENPTLQPAIKRALVASRARAGSQIALVLRDPRTPRAVAIAAVEIARSARLRLAVPRIVEQLKLGRLPKPLLIEALGKIGDPRSQRPLLELLEDRSDDVRWAALRALDRVIDERAAEPLLAALTSSVERIQLRAIRYLGRLKARIAVRPLLRLVNSADARLARRAATAVAQIGDPRAIPALIRLLSHSDRQRRQIAVVGLAHARSKETPGKLIALCQRTSGASKVACIQALGGQLRGRSTARAVSFLGGVLRTNDHSALLATIDALAAMRAPAITKMLIDRLPSLSPRFRRRIADVLGNNSAAADRAVPALIRLLGDGDPSVRGAAAWALSKLGPAATKSRPAAAAIRRALGGKGWSQRINAAAAIARGPSDGATLALLRTLSSDADPYVRANALVGIGRLPRSRARQLRPLLLDKLQNDRSPWVRINALRALRVLRPVKLVLSEGRRFESVGALTRWIAESDPDPRVRGAVAAMRRRPAVDKRSNWIGLYLLDREGHVLREARLLLITPSGMIKAGYSDARGQAWEENLRAGRCFVELPPPELPAAWADR